jgi:hypothetical protein
MYRAHYHIDVMAINRSLSEKQSQAFDSKSIISSNPDSVMLSASSNNEVAVGLMAVDETMEMGLTDIATTGIIVNILKRSSLTLALYLL